MFISGTTHFDFDNQIMRCFFLLSCTMEWLEIFVNSIAMQGTRKFISNDLHEYKRHSQLIMMRCSKRHFFQTCLAKCRQLSWLAWTLQIPVAGTDNSMASFIKNVSLSVLKCRNFSSSGPVKWLENATTYSEVQTAFVDPCTSLPYPEEVYITSIGFFQLTMSALIRKALSRNGKWSLSSI